MRRFANPPFRECRRLSLLHASLLWATWPRLLVSLVLLAFAASSARDRMRRSFPPLPWDLEWCGVGVWLSACVIAPALVLGAFGWLRDWSWAIGVLVSVALLRAWPVVAPAPQAATDPPDETGAPSAAFTIALFGFLVGRALYGLRNPPADWDSLQYHLPMVAHWMQSGSLGVAMREPPALGAYYPGNAEVMQMWAAWSALRETLMPWPGIAGLGLLGLALRRLALLAGARAAIAEGLSLCLAAAPGVSQLTFGTRIDNVLAGWFAVAMVFALRYLRTAAARDFGMMVLALGLVAGAKGTGPALALIVLAAARVGRDLIRRVLTLGASAPSVAVALLLGGFWIVRDVVATGNPLFPAEVVFGRLHWAGLESHEILWRTTQLAVWREGYAGHLTALNLWRMYGPAVALLASGELLTPLLAVRWLRPQRASRGVSVRLVCVALASFALFLVSPYSGAFWPAADGRPPGLNLDNLRYLLPVAVALVPLAATGLSLLPVALAVVVLGASFLFGLSHALGHVVPGMVAVALAIAGWRALARLRASLSSSAPARGAAAVVIVVATSGLLSVALAAVEPMRERISDRIWDGYLPRIDNLPAGVVRELRARAHGRPIACVGLKAWWAFYGRDFSGHPVYVPVGLAWSEAKYPYAFIRDDRAHADRALWLRNLDRCDAAAVVAGPISGDCAHPAVEREWCDADSARFALLAATKCDRAYEVRSR